MNELGRPLAGLGSVAASLVSRLSMPVERVSPVRSKHDLPALWDNKTERIERVTVWAWEGATRQPLLRRALSEAEKDHLSARRGALLRAVAPLDDEDRSFVLVHIARMLAGFPLGEQWDDTTAVLAGETFLHAARDLHSGRNMPPWAIVEACDLVIAGQAGFNVRFCPTAPEFGTLVRKCVSRYGEELGRIGRLLAAKAA